jgi:hypothetical protein
MADEWLTIHALADLGQRSRTPVPTPQDETANNGDASPGDRIESDDDGHHDCQYDDGCAALPGAVSPCEHDRGAPCQHGDGEDHAAGLREPEPPTEPAPIASKSNHARDARSTPD